MPNSTQKVIFSGLAVMSLAIGTNYLVQQDLRPTPFWESQKRAERSPANFLTDLDTDVYKDYFLPDKFKNYLNYDVQVRFSSDTDKEYINSKAKEALHAAFGKTFMELNAGDNPDATLTVAMKKNLVSEVMDKFVKTLYVYKIFDGNFQIDFIFTPRVISSIDYQHELSTNQLIHLDNTGSLHKKLTAQDISLPELIKNNKVPNNGELYQYLAGAISVNVELADLTPAFKIPDPKKNIVKGNVKFRKYYRINDRSLLNLNLKEKGFTVDTLHLKEVDDSKEHILTVDLIKSFNLKELVPENDRLEISFGEISDLKIKKRNLWSRFMSFINGKDITTSDLHIYGKYDGEEYKAKVEKLVYSFKEKKFTYESKINLRQDFSAHHRNASDDMQAQRWFKKELLEDSKDEVISQLKLNTFSKDIK